jgi:hypothetical protein
MTQHALIYTIYLPTELLERIFILAASRPASVWEAKFMMPPCVTTYVYDVRISVSLSHVCRMWCELALDRKILWTCSASLLGREANALDWTILQRAKDEPVELDMLGKQDVGKAPYAIADWVDKHVEVAPRFQHLRLSIPSRYLPYILALRTHLHSYTLVVPSNAVATGIKIS